MISIDANGVDFDEDVASKAAEWANKLGITDDELDASLETLMQSDKYKVDQEGAEKIKYIHAVTKALRGYFTDLTSAVYQTFRANATDQFEKAYLPLVLRVMNREDAGRLYTAWTKGANKVDLMNSTYQYMKAITSRTKIH
jgi:hypothetical protein